MAAAAPIAVRVATASVGVAGDRQGDAARRPGPAPCRRSRALPSWRRASTGEGEGDQGGDVDGPRSGRPARGPAPGRCAAPPPPPDRRGGRAPGAARAPGRRAPGGRAGRRGEIQPGVLEPHPDDDQDRRPGRPGGRHAPHGEAIRPLRSRGVGGGDVECARFEHRREQSNRHLRVTDYGQVASWSRFRSRCRRRSARILQRVTRAAGGCRRGSAPRSDPSDCRRAPG